VHFLIIVDDEHLPAFLLHPVVGGWVILFKE
jgi:hypothetical protein